MGGSQNMLPVTGTVRPPARGIDRGLRWLTFLRVLFTSFLLGSTIILHINESSSFITPPLLLLYGLTAGIFILSFIYAVILKFTSHPLIFTYLQTGIDTVIVSLIIFVTGGFLSIFSFLYLVVIIYASMLLSRRGSLIMATLCSIQYGLMIYLQYYGLLTPYGLESVLLSRNFHVSYLIYRVLIIVVACFAVALLSGFLSEQARQTRGELQAMEDHVRRVERLAATGEMAAGLAHEIKNPLASMTGAIQMLRQDLDCDAGQLKLMQIVLREADRLSALVNNFLFFARPPAGKKEIIALEKAVQETLALFEQDAVCRCRIKIHRMLTAGVMIEMDPHHLYQVLWNLLLNAAEAISGEGTIEVYMYPLRNDFVCIKITDNGCGVPSDIAKQIFDPFFTTKSRGTGLGLSIVHRILESYGSRLDLESRTGIGTTFTMRVKRFYSSAC